VSVKATSMDGFVFGFLVVVVAGMTMKSWRLKRLFRYLGLFALALIVAPAPTRAAGTQPVAPGGAGQPVGASTTASAGATALPAAAQIAPDINVRAKDADRFEYGQSVKSIPEVTFRQLVPLTETPAESIINERYFGSVDDTTRALTLKQAIYLALRNNPNVAAARLDPVGATEGVRMANGVFDPDFIATIDQTKTVLPAASPLEVKGTTLSEKDYDWNFTLNKVLMISNGTLSVSFDNNRLLTNNLFQGVTPSYTPTLGIGLIQPLLRNFGWEFSTISIRLAESAQRQSQLNYAQTLNDFVQNVGNDYWSVVAAEENLRVADEALKFNRDLVRVNRISVQVGTLAPIDLQEAQSAEATAQANVYTAQAALEIARAALREDVELNPRDTFVPQRIEPAGKPNPSEPVNDEEERSLETAIEYSPSLAALREAIHSQRLQVKYQENQLLPSFSISSQFSINSIAGDALCLAPFGGGPTNCTIPPSAVPNGYRLPFSGGYAEALNRMFGFRFYSYAFLATIEMPLGNAPIKAALAQAKVQYRQLREQYRAAASQIVVQVESALASVGSDIERVKATEAATMYARQALHDEQVRFRVGMATTHDLLQYQSQLVTAEGNQVTAETDLEKAKLALRHADNTLLRSFQIHFEVQAPHETPWYARF
jgi:outer membrane protein